MLAEEATVVDYCKMGCTSSVCNQMITGNYQDVYHLIGVFFFCFEIFFFLQWRYYFDADATSEVKKDNVMKYCGNACHQFCTKGAGTATATLAA